MKECFVYEQNNMKKLVIGLIVGFGLALPVGAFADHIVSTPNANNIYTAGINGGIEVDVFDDASNKCYVAYHDRGADYDDEQPAISCVKSHQ